MSKTLTETVMAIKNTCESPVRLTDESIGVFDVYPNSVQKLKQTVFFIARRGGQKQLVLSGSEEYFHRFAGEDLSGKEPLKLCPMNRENCVQLRELFLFTRPVSHGQRRFSFGMGDRLGIATPGHIRAVKALNVFPVLAQQSMRELNLTGRSYPAVLDDVSWAVFQEGYTGGFGADADHLKEKADVAAAIEDGYTMITLDCSEHIDNRCFGMDAKTLLESYETLPQQKKTDCEARYLQKTFRAGDAQITFDKQTLMQCMLVYAKAIDFMEEIFKDVIEKAPHAVDFEVSIDETAVPTTPEAHWFIASELAQRKVQAQSMAPRFCGEFQKGIDYIGDLTQFEKEYNLHTKIAEAFGYRVSVHSGSDKFSVFPIVGKHSKLNVHVKTAGTSWLEAVRLIAMKNPALYRRMHTFALENLEQAKKYYHIGAKTQNIPDIDTLADSELPQLMAQNDARQALHITYGLLLQAKDAAGKAIFRDEIYSTLDEYEETYSATLAKHMQKHLRLLGVLA